MHVRAIDFAYYPVQDLNRAVSFYRDTLGLTLEAMDEKAGWAEFAAPPTTLILWRGESAEATIPDGGGSGYGGGGGGVALAVDDVEAAVEELRMADTPIEMDRVDTGGCEMALITDPAGNTLLLHHRHDGTAGRRDPFP